MPPRDLKEALDIFENSDFIRKTLGNHIFTKYYEAKKKEWESYQKFVSQWEIDEYLYKI